MPQPKNCLAYNFIVVTCIHRDKSNQRHIDFGHASCASYINSNHSYLNSCITDQQNMIHILIVDDDEDDRDLLSSAIHEIDREIKCAMARNGQEALEGLRMLQFPKPQLIFIDLNMPRFNGEQFLKEIKKDRALQDIPVVIYTTSKLKGDAEKMHAVGAAHFLTKPTSFKDLCRKVHEIFVKEMIHL